MRWQLLITLALVFVVTFGANAQTVVDNEGWEFRISIRHAGAARYTIRTKTINWIWVRTRVNHIASNDSRRRPIQIMITLVKPPPPSLNYRVIPNSNLIVPPLDKTDGDTKVVR